MENGVKMRFFTTLVIFLLKSNGKGGREGRARARSTRNSGCLGVGTQQKKLRKNIPPPTIPMAKFMHYAASRACMVGEIVEKG